MAELQSLIKTIKNLATKIPNGKEIKKVTRADFVHQYLGHTILKTTALLKENKNKILFIQDAHFLYCGENDEFGMEALITLHDYILNNPDPIIIMKSEDKDLLIKILRQLKF